MNKITLINTGGTFNKYYNPLDGTLVMDTEGKALETIASKWLCELEIINIIGKDSLDITSDDREQLLETIQKRQNSHILIIHGTDTMDITANYLANATLPKSIVLTGAMVPFGIDTLEATANLASAYGYLCATTEHGVFIAMNGVVGAYYSVVKDRINGKFIKT